MTFKRRSAALVTAVAATLAAPALASAHVGKSAPVATDFHARITHPVAGVTARVVDGDQTLWLDAGRHAVQVPGIEGEPLLRFDTRGVWVNLRSLTAQTDRIDRYDLRPDPSPRAAPLWRKLTSGHTYGWHEHRLHLLEPLAKGVHSRKMLGTWTIPVLVDGHRASLAGVLDYQPPPPALAWFGAAALLAAAGALASWRSRRATIVLALAAVPIVWTLRVGRELYGRPTVGTVGWLEVALTCLIGTALLYRLFHRDSAIRVFVAFLTAFGALYQTLTMYPVLTRATALTLLPTPAARIGVVLALALGAATLPGSWSAMTNAPRTAIEGKPMIDEPMQELARSR
jgi:hypothetical protein